MTNYELWRFLAIRTRGCWGRIQLSLWSPLVYMYFFLHPSHLDYICRCEWLPGACLCQGARHPPALPAFVASQSIPGTKEASDLTLTSQWTQVSPSCHYFLWGILGGEPSATVSILNIYSVCSRKFLALLTLGFATKSPQRITALPFFHPQTLCCILFLKIRFCGRLSPQSDRSWH